MQKAECLQVLKKTFLQDTTQKSNISKLTSEARWENKTNCINEIGGITQVKLSLTNMEKSIIEGEHESAWSNITPCQEKLINTFRQDYSQKTNPTKLAATAWWDSKGKCLNEIWGYTPLKNFLKNIENTYPELHDASNLKTGAIGDAHVVYNPWTDFTITGAAQTWSIQEQVMEDESFEMLMTFWRYAMYAIITFFAIFAIIWIYL